MLLVDFPRGLLRSQVETRAWRAPTRQRETGSWAPEQPLVPWYTIYLRRRSVNFTAVEKVERSRTHPARVDPPAYSC